MKKNTIRKQGFSLMELLITMVILSGLATVVIPNMSDSQEAVKLRVMENDTLNTAKTLKAKLVTYSDYTEVFSEGTIYTDSNNDGKADTALADGTYLDISEGNSIALGYDSSCDNGLTIAVVNSQYTAKGVSFTSCKGKIKVVETGVETDSSEEVVEWTMPEGNVGVEVITEGEFTYLLNNETGSTQQIQTSSLEDPEKYSFNPEEGTFYYDQDEL